MTIYTKTGDRGMTSLVGGQRVSKCCCRLDAYGTVDELNSHLGMLMTYCTDDADTSFLAHAQSVLFVVGGYLATDNSTTEVREGNVVTQEMTTAVEQEIDRLQANLPPLRLFVVPGGTRAASCAHVARTVCRRAERMVLRLEESGAKVDDTVTAYLNRLSDYLFVLARKLNADKGVADKVWKRTLMTLAAIFIVAIGSQAQSDSLRTAMLNPVVVTATGTYHRADNAPVSVKVISAKDIRDMQATSVQDALSKLSPNITTHTNGMGSFVNFNGVSDDYLLILENGRRVSGDDRWSRISLENVKRIEIFSGAASALYGSEAIAGVVNIITEESRQRLEVGTRTKVMNHGRSTSDVNLDLNLQHFSSYTSYTHQQADNWQVNEYQEFEEKDKDGSTHSVLKLNGRPMSQGFDSHNVSQKFEWRLSDSLSFYVTGNYYDHETHRPQSAISFSQSKTTDKESGDISYSYKAKQAYTYDLHHTSYMYGGGARWIASKRARLYLDVYCDNFTSKYDYWQTADMPAYDETRKRTHYVNETLRGIFRIAKWNKLSAGIELVQESLNSESDNIDFETTNTYNVFAQDEITILPGLEALCGVRYIYNDNFGSHLTPNVGLFFHTGGFRARASYAGGYRTPSLSQLYATDQAKTSGRYTINNTALKPETNHFFNLNLEYGNSWLRVGVTGFHNRINDMINYRTLTEQEIAADDHLSALHEEWQTIRQRDNIDKATLKGVSANVKLLMPCGLTLGVGYTFTDALSETMSLNSKTQQYEMKRNDVDKSVRHVANVNIAYDKTWTDSYRMHISLNGHLQSRRYSSTYGYAAGYGQWDLNMRHIITLRQLELHPSVGIENLFNKVDRSYWTSNFSTISPGRSLSMSIALRFRD